jgi:hypothetical protein
MKLVADAAREILVRGGPLVFVDTCSVLDLARSPRDGFRGRHAGEAVELISLAVQQKITFLLPEQVSVEYQTNIFQVQQEADRQVKKLNAQMSTLHDILRFYGKPVAAFAEISEEGFAEACRAVMDSLVDSAICSKTTNDAKLNAGNRVIAGRVPAGSSKQSFKDCLVLESCYETLRAARAVGFFASAHFLSSNTAEYSLDRMGLHPDLVDDFSALGLEYASTFAELRYHTSIKDL